MMVSHLTPITWTFVLAYMIQAMALALTIGHNQPTSVLQKRWPTLEESNLNKDANSNSESLIERRGLRSWWRKRRLKHYQNAIHHHQEEIELLEMKSQNANEALGQPEKEQVDEED
ncbi:hypothetical protein BASA50_003159 [Batrachochytrium salamandrivorans]|uniref:Uncharacterized protein n=1 Tax=Batrachochytrium salamandrivorans TaxID=1357716 RepID=A0ABQ8F0A7_9FUNG|nr:hypothetical protein BASA62_010217 [Batrachochytrium salamandrivorans]KAH6562482.1 hypothetical protein BASA60_011106 [Batrachochytrium salamandrivorans]KAH6579781.1 hypothetical protein BASA61_010051 [Batrachochytrium salamandrivorans]KAH6589788.1 hypothetical protein BASA50_009806 [Batrachochytrium salamandrivorans]KAH6599273.1 hypothetical protein BASA50_003159 [Batrachochytrium salamandrivorans]